MKSRLSKLALFILLGAIMNIAICWIFSARPIHYSLNWRHKSGHSNIGENGHWDIGHSHKFGRVRLHSRWIYEWEGSYTYNSLLPPAHELLPDWAIKIDNIQPTKINSAEILAEATGWPLPAMLAHYERGANIKDASGSYNSPILAPNGLVISEINERDGLIIPFQPIWPGFAINTIFYAAILWLPFAPIQLRRYMRSKRGMCIKCGYDLRETKDKCPECGWGREAEA